MDHSEIIDEIEKRGWFWMVGRHHEDSYDHDVLMAARGDYWGMIFNPELHAEMKVNKADTWGNALRECVRLADKGIYSDYDVRFL